MQNNLKIDDWNVFVIPGTPDAEKQKGCPFAMFHTNDDVMRKKCITWIKETFPKATLEGPTISFSNEEEKIYFSLLLE